jgi:ABC-type branched-subunit amino acid transport system ATPase component
MSELAGKCGTLAKHPFYNLDLAHRDFWIFPKLKQELHRKKFSSGIQVMLSTATTLCTKS